MSKRAIIMILTNAGYKYDGKLISEDKTFITLKDTRRGRIKVPLSNISFLKEVEQ